MSEDHVAELLKIWLRQRAAGVSVAPDELCRDSPELLAELRRRIQALGTADTRTASPAVDWTQTLLAPPVTNDPAPTTLGGYRIIRRLGEGGMGLLIEAEDARLGRRVAIKVMRPELACVPAVRERFLREARAAAAVRHDHVVPIYHIGEDGRNLFLVMPLLAGESLADRLDREGALPPAEVARVAREAALGLAAAHAAGLVHRDVKPGNLFLEAPQGRVLVLDFGLARAVEGVDVLTRPGSVLGTPGYLAPEQANGLAVDARSDLFGLGASLYHAATGTRPFRGDTLTAILRAVAEHDPPPPHAVNPSVPRALSDLIMRMLAKGPNERPSSAGTVAEEAAQLLTHPATAVPQVRTREVRKASTTANRRRQLQIGCTVTLSFCLVVGLALGGYLSLYHPRPTEVAEKPQDKEKDKTSVVAPEKRFALYPAKWAPVESAGTHVIGDKHYHHTLTRKVAGEELVAILVYPTRADHPEPFYILQNKITNRVFAQMWGEVLKGTQAPRAEDLERDFPTFGTWRKGAETVDGEFLGIDGDQAGVPVLGVTLPEAMLVADELGGRLPSILQWKKAVGALNEDKRPGPAGAPLLLPDNLKGPAKRAEAAEWMRKSLAERNLALGLKYGPWPVAKQTTDVSFPWKVHQLVSNGQEWLGEDVNEHPFNLANIADRFPEAVVVGQGPNELVVLTFDMMRRPATQGWTKTSPATGFRVVLKPQ
jgi:serine/threonine protein kinase